MKKFRTVIFWAHLAAGLIAGVVIFIMSVTGALLSFERQMIEASERDARTVAVPVDAQALPPSQILGSFIASRPEAEPATLTILNEPDAAWQLSLGRGEFAFIDPYTGSVTGGENRTVRDIMSSLRSWHRWLAMSDDSRPIGKAITGASNLLFFFLAISGIYIWFPRNLSWRSAKNVLWFKRGLTGRARNFNWHNTIGFWTSLLLIVFTLTATVISYRWASDLLYTLTGNTPPASGRGGGGLEKAPYALPENLDLLVERAASHTGVWRSIALRLPISENEASFTIDEGIYWNIFGRSSLTLDAATGEVKTWEPYGEQNAGRQLRTWFRFTHTGETGGIPGQILGLIACVGGAFLVWTGFSLAFRRFGRWLKGRRQDELA